MTTTEASVNVGVARRTGWLWWRHAGGVKLRKGGCGLGGVAAVGNPVGIGGRGHRLDAAERVEIMRGLDAGLSYAAIGRRLGRDRSVIWREVQRNRLIITPWPIPVLPSGPADPKLPTIAGCVT
nr:helix-turn-helix domain-containing protein [Mycolicibacterium psychrotolerans]